jgi:hypothetical protein
MMRSPAAMSKPVNESATNCGKLGSGVRGNPMIPACRYRH